MLRWVTQMETFLADDYRARVARIEETRTIGDQITELSGHINAASGHGPWPEGLLMFAELMKRLRA